MVIDYRILFLHSEIELLQKRQFENKTNNEF